MSVLEPSSDDEFERIVAGLEGEMEAPGDVISIADLEDKQLIERHTEIRSFLMEAGELIHQTTQDGRDKASELAVIRFEISRRTGREL